MKATEPLKRMKVKIIGLLLGVLAFSGWFILPTQAQFGHSSWVSALQWSPDSQFLASGSYDGTVRIWNPRTGMPLAKFDVSPAQIFEVGWSPDGRFLLAWGTNEEILVWDANRQKLVFRCAGRDGKWSPDGKRIFLRSPLRTEPPFFEIVAWDADALASGKALSRTKTLLPGECAEARWSFDGSFLAMTLDDPSEGLKRHVCVLEVGKKPSERFFLKPETVTCGAYGYTNLAWSPTENLLAVAEGDGLVRLWNPLTRTQTVCLKGLIGVPSLSWSRDGFSLASSAQHPDDTLRVWNVSTGRQLACHEWGYWLHGERFFFPDDFIMGQKFAQDGTLLESKKPVKLQEAGTCRESLAASPDGRFFASGDRDSFIRIFDASTGKIVRTIGSPASMIRFQLNGLLIGE